MDKYQVKIKPKAIRELDGIFEYIALEKMAPENAKGQMDRIKKAILKLNTFPQSHQERNEGRYAGKGYRQLLVDNYILNTYVYAATEAFADNSRSIQLQIITMDS